MKALSPSPSSAMLYLLGFLRHHEHQIKVVRSQRVFVQVIHVDEEEEVLQCLFSTHGTGSVRRAHWTNTQKIHIMRTKKTTYSTVYPQLILGVIIEHRVLTSQLVDFLQSNLQLWHGLLHMSRQYGQKEPGQRTIYCL